MCGIPDLKRDRNFEKKVSFAVTNAAITKFNIGRFEQALKFVNQNIENNVATDDDYLLKACCLLNLYDTPDSNAEALSLICKAKEINPKNINIVKTEIISSIRNGLLSEARTLLSKYMEDLDSTLASIDVDSPKRNLFTGELDWARKMRIKVQAL